MSEFNFKSAICTSIEQSKRLLALGLKKETADMWYPHFAKTYPIPLVDEVLTTDDIPAWSLHRLWELVNIAHIILDSENEIPTLYDSVIDFIESKIKEGVFNKNYLEE